MSAVCGLRFTDLRRVAFSCKQRFQFISIASDKGTKQSRDLSLLITTLREAVRLWLNDNAMFCESIMKVFQCPRNDSMYCSAIVNKSIPDSLLHSETQASCYHLTRTHIAG